MKRLLAEIFQVQSAIGQMTGYPEVERGGRGGLRWYGRANRKRALRDPTMLRDSLVVVSMP